ncbi:MAG: acetyl-CoA carboxylase [Chloroflexota bacterium]
MAMDTDQSGDRLLAVLPRLLQELTESGVVELEVTVGSASLYLRQRPGATLPRPTAAPEGADAALTDDGLVAVTTPLAGVFYAAPSPDEPPYVVEGETVEAGQVVALIEAMKVFNEIHVDVAGVVERILVTSGQSVRAGQPLITIRPNPSALLAADHVPS